MKPQLKKSIWISFDLGLKGDYSALFSYLDNHQAIDCGNGLAYLKYDNSDLLNSEALIKRITTELYTTIKPSPTDRIYIIWKDDEKLSGNIKGKFIIGNRKTPVWHGYGDFNFDDEIDEETFS